MGSPKETKLERLWVVGRVVPDAGRRKQKLFINLQGRALTRASGAKGK